MRKKAATVLFAVCLLFLISFLLFPAAVKAYKKKQTVLNDMPIPHQIINNKAYARNIFARLEEETAHISKPTLVAESELHRGKNRHKSFLPFDETRTCREIEGFYISASDITTPKQSYIIAQGPTEKTAHDFWKMIFYKQCTLITSLCMPIESGNDKCCPYWEKPFLPEEVLGWRLLSVKEQVIQHGKEGQKIVAREFLFRRSSDEKQHQVTQLHYQEWPDLGVPQCDLFCTLLDFMDPLTDAKIPIVVHCSAGIGRSGTLVASHSLRKEKKEGISPNVLQRIYDLRQQRAKVVTNTAQFQFVYEALAQEDATACE